MARHPCAAHLEEFGLSVGKRNEEENYQYANAKKEQNEGSSRNATAAQCTRRTNRETKGRWGKLSQEKMQIGHQSREEACRESRG